MGTIHPGTGHTITIITVTGVIVPTITPAAIRKERITEATVMTAMSEMTMPIAGIVVKKTDRRTPLIVAIDVMVPEVIPRPQ